MFKEYIAYLRDNPQRLWFKRKLYGWGWTPARWQGWLAVALYILAVVQEVGTYSGGVDDSIESLIGRIIVATIVLIALCYWKGEKPRWQWGLPKSTNE